MKIPAYVDEKGEKLIQWFFGGNLEEGGPVDEKAHCGGRHCVKIVDVVKRGIRTCDCYCSGCQSKDRERAPGT